MSNPDCLFCKIIKKELPADFVYEDEHIVAFKDINPIAPVHILIVPRKHMKDNNDFMEEDEHLAGRIFTLVRKLAEQEGIAEDGYRIFMNTGKHGKQIVPHMHLHLVGGRQL